MASRPENGGVGRFSFGEMALSEEARVPGAGGDREGRGEGGTVLNETVEMLRVCAVNEEHCVEIMPFAEEVVTAVRELVARQEEVVDEEEEVDGDGFEACLKRLEIERLNYLLRSYFRVRLRKIEKSVLFVFKDESVYDRLSPEEQKFAVAYMDLVEDHFNKGFFAMLPKKLRVLDKDGTVDHATAPNLDKFVFCRVKSSVGSYAVSEEANDAPLALERGDILCIRYGGIRELLQSDDVELI